MAWPSSCVSHRRPLMPTAYPKNDQVNMKKNTLELAAAIPATGLNRRNFLKTACVAATAVATTQLAAKEQTQRATPGMASVENHDEFIPGNTVESQDTFKPGDKVSASGIYDVIHDRIDGDAHAHPHQVVVAGGRKFPPCRGCGGGVTFRLHQAVEPIEAHHLFGT